MGHYSDEIEKHVMGLMADAIRLYLSDCCKGDKLFQALEQYTKLNEKE